METTTSSRRTVDLLVVGAGAGLTGAIAAADLGLSTLVVEKTSYVGGSTARSGGAFWIPANPVLERAGAGDTPERGLRYLDAVVGDAGSHAKLEAYVRTGPETVRLLERRGRMTFTWARGYSDYHPELPGGSAQGRSCECQPFDLTLLGEEKKRFRPGMMSAPLPMPILGKDYKWLNLIRRVPTRGLPIGIKRVAQGVGGMALKKDYAGGGQALAAGLFDAALRAGVEVWTDSPMVELLRDGDRVTGAVVEHEGGRVEVHADAVLLTAGGFDHDLARRHETQSPSLEKWTLGAEGNTGDGLRAGSAVGAATDLLDQVWWFPAFASPEPGGEPLVLLAERSLPGSFMVDRHGRRFVDEAVDYMSFGQQVIERERDGDPVGRMWLVFDQKYRNSYLMAGQLFPGMPLPREWYEAGTAVRASTWGELAQRMGVDPATFTTTAHRFNELAAAGVDEDFGRGASAYDRYYGDPTVTPNPNLRPVEEGKLLAVEIVLADLGTCGGLVTDEFARVLTEDGHPIPGLYAAGNTTANAFGRSYPGAGATIGQSMVFSHIAALHTAGRVG